MHTLKRSPDAVAGLAVAVLGTVYLVAAFQIEPDPSATSVVGPRVAPMVIGAATVVCAVALLVRGLHAPDAASAADVASEAGAATAARDGRDAKLSRRQVLVSFGIFAAYIVAFIPLGYLLSTFGFLVAMTTYVERRKLLRNCVFGAVFAPVVYVLFNYGLQVQLPPGLLG